VSNVADAALLITAIATAIGSISSAVGVLVVVRRSSPREREDAARQAAEQVLNPQPSLAEKAAVIAQLPPAEKKRRRHRGGRRP
jgi:hypothetical protein